MILDPTSGLFYLVAVTAASGITALVLWRRHPQLKGLGLVALGSLATGPTFATLMVRNSHANTLHNVLATAAEVAVTEGMLVFLGRRANPRFALGMVAAAAVIWELILAFSSNFYVTRIVAATTLGVLIFGRGIVLMRKLHPQRPLDAAEVLLLGTLVVHVSVLTARMMAALIHPVPGYIHTPIFQGWFFLELIVVHVVLYYSLLMMVGNRLARDLHQQSQVLEAERRHKQELHFAKQRAEDALAEKSRFLAATGHDLRQVTHAMKLLLAAVDHELTHRDQVESDLGGLTDEMMQLTNSMTEQLNALLEIARLDSGTLLPCCVEFPLSLAFDTLNTQFSRMAEDEGVDLRVMSSSLILNTDRGLLLRILGNLIHNAVKFGKGGRVIVGCRRTGTGASIQIWDEGPGISSEHLEMIFQEYRQVGNRNRDHLKGLGLGLSIAQRTAKLLGMRVRVRSIPGRWTMFAVDVGKGGP